MSSLRASSSCEQASSSDSEKSSCFCAAAWDAWGCGLGTRDCSLGTLVGLLRLGYGEAGANAGGDPVLVRGHLQLAHVERQRRGHQAAEARADEPRAQWLLTRGQARREVPSVKPHFGVVGVSFGRSPARLARGQQAHGERCVAEQHGPQIEVERLGRRLVLPVGVDSRHPPTDVRLRPACVGLQPSNTVGLRPSNTVGLQPSNTVGLQPPTSWAAAREGSGPASHRTSNSHTSNR